MKLNRHHLITLTAAGGLLLGVAPLFAHHSFMAEFDKSKPVLIEGTVTEVDWINPHTLFYVDAKNEKGGTEHWILETGSPSVLIHRGWTKTTMKKGDHISVRAYLSKERHDKAAARSVTFPDGRTLFGGQTDDGGPMK